MTAQWKFQQQQRDRARAQKAASRRRLQGKPEPPKPTVKPEPTPSWGHYFVPPIGLISGGLFSLPPGVVCVGPGGTTTLATTPLSDMSGVLSAASSTLSDYMAGTSIVHELSDVFPQLRDRLASCPKQDCPYSFRPLVSIIPHLNDAHQWTREQIADWLETLDVDLTIQPTSKGD